VIKTTSANITIPKGFKGWNEENDKQITLDEFMENENMDEEKRHRTTTDNEKIL